MAPLLADIITDILVRLPAKSLLRFKSISKPLCSQIESPEFTKLHLHHHSTKSHQLLILSRNPDYKPYSLDLPSLDESHEIDHPFATDRRIDVLGSCNGLLCLSVYPDDEKFLWNPSTRKHLKLELPPVTPVPWSEAYIWHCVVYGLGYDSLRDDHILLRIVQIEKYCDPEIHAYSVRRNLWRLVPSFPYNLVPMQSSGSFVRGALHFLVDPTAYPECYSFIIAVDLGEEYPYREVPVPPELLDKGYCDLGVLNDECLSVACYDSCGEVGVWVMKDYGAVDSWSKVVSFSGIKELEILRMKPIVTVGDGDEVILYAYGRMLIRCDLTKKRGKVLNVQGMPASFGVHVYVESLVDPMPTALPDDHAPLLTN